MNTLMLKLSVLCARSHESAAPQVLTPFRERSEVRPTLSLHDDDTDVIGAVIITCPRG